MVLRGKNCQNSSQKKILSRRYLLYIPCILITEDQSATTSVAGEPETVVEDDVLYDCVICGQSTPSTAEKTVGLVVLLQASSGKEYNFLSFYFFLNASAISKLSDTDLTILLVAFVLYNTIKLQ